MSSYPHTDVPSFVEAVRTTARKTGFAEALVEKDYFCSLILREIYAQGAGQLVFKGGTLLNKVHAGFYRLSEDLDFSINLEPGSSRKSRSDLARPLKERFGKIIEHFQLRFLMELKGSNENTQYNGEIEYNSLIFGVAGTVRIEVSLRERVFEKRTLKARTLVRDPFTDEALIPDFEIQGLSLREAYAEKIRAALSRKDPAIRDVFDIDYALKSKLFELKEIIPMARQKLQTLDIKISEDRKRQFLSQLSTQLRPVLRSIDFEQFDFEEAWVKLNELKNFIEAVK